MNIKVSIAITAVVSFVAFTFLNTIIIAWLPSVLVGVFLLLKSKNNKENKLVGFLILKSLLLLSVLQIGPSFDLDPNGGFLYLAFVPDLIVTLILAFYFRNLLEDKLILVFFLGDLTRWVSLFIEVLLPDPYPEPFFYTQAYIFFFLLLIFPPLYAVYGFMEVRSTTSSHSKTH